MVEAARIAVRHDPRMREFYYRVARRRGDWSVNGRLYGAKLKVALRFGCWFRVCLGCWSGAYLTPFMSA